MILSAVTTGAEDVSSTVYVVPSDPAKLETPVYLRVEVLFDLPRSTVVPRDSATWGLGVNLKRGTATDAGTDADTPVGPNCQFNPQKLSGTGVRLTGVEVDNGYLDTRSYGLYGTNKTLFGLRADLNHAGLNHAGLNYFGLNYFGSASLVLSDQSGPKVQEVQQGTLLPQDFHPSITPMAIGIVLVNQGGEHAKTVSVQLHSFAIWTRPVTIEVEHLLLKQHAGPDPQVIVPSADRNLTKGSD